MNFENMDFWEYEGMRICGDIRMWGYGRKYGNLSIRRYEKVRIGEYEDWEFFWAVGECGGLKMWGFENMGSWEYGFLENKFI